MTPPAVHLRPEDNVAVAARHLPDGADVLGVRLPQRVGLGHKIALVPIQKGEAVRHA